MDYIINFLLIDFYYNFHYKSTHRSQVYESKTNISYYMQCTTLWILPNITCTMIMSRNHPIAVDLQCCTLYISYRDLFGRVNVYLLLSRWIFRRYIIYWNLAVDGLSCQIILQYYTINSLHYSRPFNSLWQRNCSLCFDATYKQEKRKRNCVCTYSYCFHIWDM